MKKIVLALSIALMFTNQVFAQDYNEINEKIASIGFGKLFSADPQEQITKLFTNYTKYSNKHNINKLKSLYDDKYVNADGFDLNMYFELVKQAWDAYPDMAYINQIEQITVNGDYATVQTKETVSGNAAKPSEYLEDKGTLESSSSVVYYLQKNGNKWVITSDAAISEKTFLKYGDAKSISFDIIAPYTVVAGQEYSVLFAADMPVNKMLLGSITNEKITYPAQRPKEVFRKLKEDGILERFVRANKDGYNEQAVVSVGITKAEIDESMDMKLSVSGVAFLITRVNVIQPKNFKLDAQPNEKASEL